MNYLNINERNIPTLHFLSLHSNKSYCVSLSERKNFNIYEFLKSLIEKTSKPMGKLKELENRISSLKRTLSKYNERKDNWFPDYEKQSLFSLVKRHNLNIEEKVLIDLFDLIDNGEFNKRKECWRIFNEKIKPNMELSDYSQFQKFIDRSFNIDLQLKLEVGRKHFLNTKNELAETEHELSISFKDFEKALEDYVNSDIKELASLDSNYAMIDKEIELLISKNIPERIKNELINIKEISKIESKTPMKTLFSIAKILEDSLRNKYNRHDLKFHGLIELSFSKKEISQHEFHLLNGLRCLRNLEAHTLNYDVERNIAISGILTGLVLINKFYLK